jgi:hypothetical protein
MTINEITEVLHATRNDRPNSFYDVVNIIARDTYQSQADVIAIYNDFLEEEYKGEDED